MPAPAIDTGESPSIVYGAAATADDEPTGVTPRADMESEPVASWHRAAPVNLVAWAVSRRRRLLGR